MINMCALFRPKKWNENLERPHLDYSEIYDEDVGQIPGRLIQQCNNYWVRWVRVFVIFVSQYLE